MFPNPTSKTNANRIIYIYCELQQDKHTRTIRTLISYNYLIHHRLQSIMRIELHNDIIRNPEPEDAGTITINAKVVGYNPTFTASSFVEAFIDYDNEECRSKEDLNYFLMESGINDDDTVDAILRLI